VLAAARGELGAAPGPVHVNVGLREPLVPDGATAWVEPLDGRADGGRGPPGCHAAVPRRRRRPAGPHRRRAGDGPPGPAAQALALARARGWPVVAEPSSSAAPTREVLLVPELLLSQASWLAATGPTGCWSSAGRRCRARSAG
jgi:2-succinyl-5-enolpyruvyl-6-hydroxy-3-cyclohexene-1-carboxylate synthase